MQALGSLVVVAAALLGTAGIAKLLRPTAASVALRAVRLPSAPSLVRLLGAGEVALAVAVTVTAHRLLLAAMAVTYLSFAGFVILSIRAGERHSCGCFGESTTPPGPIHVVVDLAVAAIAVAAALGTVPALPDLVAGGVWRSSVVVAGVGLATFLMIALLTTLPQTMSAVAQVSGGRR